MKPIKIIADSTCDLSQELIDEFNIDIIPLVINLGENSLLDGVEISACELVDWATANKAIPQTACPSLDSVTKIYEKYASTHDILVYTISSEMSSSFIVAKNAAEFFPDTRITVIDSRNLSTGNGLQVIAAARMLQSGATYEEIIENQKEICPLVRASFVVDDVIYLHKGGRCSALSAYGATAIKLKPTFIVRDGKLKVDIKVRGNIAKATMKYVESMREAMLAARDDTVFITHCCALPEVVAEVFDFVKSLNHFKNIYITTAGGVVSSHCGAGTFGVLYIAK